MKRASRMPRRVKTSCNFVVGECLDYLNVETWDSLVAGQSLFLSRAYQEVLHASGPRTLQNRYGLIYDGSQAIAAMVVHLIDEEKSPENSSRLRLPAAEVEQGGFEENDWIQRAPTSTVSPRQTMLCGDYYTGGFHGVAIHPRRSLASLWPAITGFLDRVKRQEGFVSRGQDCIVIKDIPSTLASGTRALRSSQYRPLSTSSSMHMTLPGRWECFDDYLNHLNVRHRMGAYRVVRDLSRAGVRMVPIDDLGASGERMHELHRMVQRNDQSGLPAMPVGFLTALVQRLGQDQYRCTGLIQDDTLVGYVTTLKDRDTAVCYSLGWDTALGGGLRLLPALLHGVIKDALTLGCSQIDFGRTALKAKAQIGAHPRASESWIQWKGDVPLDFGRLLEPLSHAPRPDPHLSI